MKILAYLKTHAVLAVTLAVVIAAGGIIAGRVATQKQNTVVAASNTPQVTLVPAQTFREGVSTVSADGVIESVSQVDIKSQLSAPLMRVNVKIGESIAAGQIIAELENADIRAQLEQAQAALAVAQGQYYNGSVSLESAQKAVIDKLNDGYQKADDVVHNQVDQFLYSNSGGTLAFYQSIFDRKLSESIHTERQDTDREFPIWRSKMDALSATSTEADINATIASAKETLTTISAFLEDLSQALNKAVENSDPNTTTILNQRKAVVAGARNTISGALSGLTGAETTLAGARAPYQSSASAQVSVASAGVKNLQAQLAKTIFTSPISGKVAALPLREGELASPGQLIATVVGAGGLQVKAYASSEDFNRLRLNAHTTIGQGISGTLVSIAPSINEANKKIELKIAINSTSTGLVVGQSVQATIDAGSAAGGNATSTEGSATYLLPMQDVKIIPGEAYVFTVDADSKIQKNSVTLGEVRGEFVEVKGGLTDDMKIVTPVYELNEGETVRVTTAQ